MDKTTINETIKIIAMGTILIVIVFVALISIIIYFGTSTIPAPSEFNYSSFYEGAIIKNGTENWLLHNGTKSKIVNNTTTYIILYDMYQQGYYIIPDNINGVKYFYHTPLNFENIQQGEDIIINQVTANLSNYSHS